jgi:hypothetical protein
LWSNEAELIVVLCGEAIGLATIFVAGSQTIQTYTMSSFQRLLTSGSQHLTGFSLPVLEVSALQVLKIPDSHRSKSQTDATPKAGP